MHVQVVLTVDRRRVVKIMGLATDSCNKLTVFDSNGATYWTSAFDCVEVRFKTEEKEF
jgi:hypothetical protein